MSLSNGVQAPRVPSHPTARLDIDERYYVASQHADCCSLQVRLLRVCHCRLVVWCPLHGERCVGSHS